MLKWQSGSFDDISRGRDRVMPRLQFEERRIVQLYLSLVPQLVMAHTIVYALAA